MRVDGHNIPDADPALYAESFVDKDKPTIALEPHVETAVDEHQTEIAPEPYEFQTVANDEVSSADHERGTDIQKRKGDRKKIREKIRKRKKEKIK